jgi:hypothetical protein
VVLGDARSLVLVAGRKTCAADSLWLRVGLDRQVVGVLGDGEQQVEVAVEDDLLTGTSVSARDIDGKRDRERLV